MSTSKSTEYPHRDELAAMFRDALLVLGGVFAVQGTEDETVRRVAAGLESVYRRSRREHQAARRGPNLKPHLAIAALLRLTDRDDDPTPVEKTQVTPATDLDEYHRLPGLFRGWEVAQVLDADHEFHIDGAGSTSDDAQLFAVYRRKA